MSKPIAVQMAYEVIDLYRENMRLRSENEELREYRQKYIDELNGSIKHNEQLMGTMLGALLDKDSVISLGFAAKAKVPA